MAERIRLDVVQPLGMDKCQKILDFLYKLYDLYKKPDGFFAKYGSIKLDRQINGGSFGTIYSATSEKQPKELLAVKFMDSTYLARYWLCDGNASPNAHLDDDIAQKYISTFEAQGNRELENNTLAYENGLPVMPVYGTYTESADRILALEYPCDVHILIMPCLHTLEDETKARSDEYISMDEALFYMDNLCIALEQLHRYKILHRDIKPNNLFLNEKRRAIIGDFGLSKSPKDSDETQDKTVPVDAIIEKAIRETRSLCIDDSLIRLHFDLTADNPYKDFEFLQDPDTKSSRKSDIFALGMTFLYMTTRKSSAREFLKSKTNNYDEKRIKKDYLLDLRSRIRKTYEGENPELDFLDLKTEPEVVTIISKALRYPVGESYKNATEFREAIESEIKRRYSAANSKVNDLENKLSMFETKALQDKNAFDIRIKALNAELNSTNIERNSAKEQYVKLKGENLNLTRQLVTEQEKARKLQAENGNLRNGTSTSSSGLKKIAELEEAVTNANKKRNDAIEAYKYKEKQYDSLNRDFTALKTENEKLQAKSHKTHVAFASFILAVIVAMVALFWHMYPNPFRSADFIGLSANEAEAEIKAVGWTVNTENIFDGQHELGTVSSQKINRFKKSVDLSVSQGLQEEAVNGDAVSIEASESKIVMESGEKYQLLVRVDTALEDYNYTVYFKQSLDVDVEWGKWLNGNTTLLAFTATEQNEGYIRVSVVNDDTDEVAAYTDVYVVVR